MKHTILIILAVIATAASYACECRNTKLSEEVEYADQIFIGKVLNKNIVGVNAYYLFSISKILKGNKNYTLSIRTGLGGPDCGMEFEVGKTYLVYSRNNQTTRCRRNVLADGDADIVRLKYLLNTYFSNDIGKTDSPLLTDNEAEYFNAEFSKQREDFDFYGKKIAFVLGASFIDKKKYFDDYGGEEVVANLVMLTEEEKLKANGYDAIIVLWRKQGVSNHFRKKIIKRLT